jgi:hypothetical protein
VHSAPSESKFSLFKDGNKLNLANQNLAPENMRELIAYLEQHRDITDLDLSNNPIGNDGAKLLADLTGIQKLNAQNCRLTTN